jgi:hypothetical protein
MSGRPCGTKHSAAQAHAQAAGRGHAKGRGHRGQEKVHTVSAPAPAMACFVIRHRPDTDTAQAHVHTQAHAKAQAHGHARAQHTSHIVMSSQPRSNSASVGMDVRSSLWHTAQRSAGKGAGGRQGGAEHGPHRAGAGAATWVVAGTYEPMISSIKVKMI